MQRPPPRLCRWTARALGACALAAVLAACSGEGGPAPPPDPAPTAGPGAPSAPPLTPAADAASAQTPAAGPASGCPAQHFDAFLRAFAADPQLRLRYTRPSVRIWASPPPARAGEASPVGPIGETVPASAYSGFRLVFRGGAFRALDPAGALDPHPVEPSVQAEAQGRYLVWYRQGTGQGQAYRFEAQDGCWFLAEEPDPASVAPPQSAEEGAM